MSALAGERTGGDLECHDLQPVAMPRAVDQHDGSCRRMDQP